jgi:hypothetical protein
VPYERTRSEGHEDQGHLGLINAAVNTNADAVESAGVNAHELGGDGSERGREGRRSLGIDVHN